jgi:hypothetical protein
MGLCRNTWSFSYKKLGRRDPDGRKKAKAYCCEKTGR